MIKENRQMSLTEVYFDKEIKLELLYKKVNKVGRDIHFARTNVTIAQYQYIHSDKLYKPLNEAHDALTSSLNWLGEALYFISKELPKDEAFGDYWKLRDMQNSVLREQKVDLSKLKFSVTKARKDLFGLLDEYHSYISETSVLMSIFEAMIEEIRKTVHILEKMKFYEY